MYNNQNRQNPNYVRRNSNGYVNHNQQNHNPNYQYQNGNYANGNYGNGNGYVPQMMPNPNYNPNFNQPVMANNANNLANTTYQPIQPMANTSIQQVVPIAPAPPVIKTTKEQHAISAYLAEVTSFCTQLNAGEVKMLPKHLTLSEAVEIVVVADRLQVSRMDALKCWGVCNKGIIISAEFLGSLFESRKLITSEITYVTTSTYMVKSDSCSTCHKVIFSTTANKIIGEEISELNAIENSLWDKDLPLALREVALMSALRKGFPQLTMSIISPAEVPNSSLDKAKRILKKLYRFGVSFFRSCFAGTDNNAEVSSNNVNSNVVENNVIENKSNIIENKSNVVENNAGKTCINLEKRTTEVPKTIKLSPTKTDSIVEVEEDNFFLDLSELEIRSKGKETSRIN